MSERPPERPDDGPLSPPELTKAPPPSFEPQPPTVPPAPNSPTPNSTAAPPPPAFPLPPPPPYTLGAASPDGSAWPSSAPGGVAVSPVTGVGIRALAIIIDAFVWFGFAVPLWSTQKSVSPGTGFHFYVGGYINQHQYYLSGFPLLISMLAWLGYMAAMEAAFGASIGKFVTGQRVVMEDGSSITLRASILRNLMRFIDGLFFYLVGAICIWSSPRNMRLGDQVAKTEVVTKRSEIGVPGPKHIAHLQNSLSPRPAIAIVTIPVIFLLIGGYVGLNQVPAGTYRQHGIAFQYPPNWNAGTVDPSTNIGSTPLFIDAFRTVEPGGVTVSGYRLASPVDTPEQLDAIRPQLDTIASELASSVQGQIQEPLKTTTVGGHPAMEFTTSAQFTGLGESGTIRVVAVFNGITQYAIRCESVASNASAIDAGCQQIVNTFRTT